MRPVGEGRAHLLVVALALAVLLPAFLVGCRNGPAAERPPNIVIVLADDLGWGDLASYGHPSIDTPNLDRLAAEGQRWTSFYSPSAVCSPSRAGLLTGRLPERSGLYGVRSEVLFPDDPGGIPDNEVTLAEALRERGYLTAIVGKWHLGDRPEFLPTRHGFDSWLGIPYSNDMMWTLPPELAVRRDAYFDPKSEYWNVPLVRSERSAGDPAIIRDEILEQPADQQQLTRRYTEEAVAFIGAHREQPFFLYVAHSMPHMPLFRSPEHAGKSRGGVYGDVIEEIDWSVGRIVEALRAAGLEENTLLVFTSDNGPWTLFREHAGSAGPLRDGKGTTFEGGMRVPALFWWPGRIEPGVVRDLGSALDLYTTAIRIAGAQMPEDRVVDGVDLRPALFGVAASARTSVPYYRGGELYAFRRGPWKLHLITEGAYGQPPARTEHAPPLLFDLEHDPGERWDRAAQHPEVVAELLREIAAHRAGLELATPIFDRRFAGGE